MKKNDSFLHNNDLHVLHKEISTLSNLFLDKFNQREFVLFDFLPHKRIFLFIFTRAIKTYHSICLLCDQGYGQDAAPLLRSLLENLISTRYILKDEKKSDFLTKRFVGYKWIILKKRISSQIKKSQRGKAEDEEPTEKNKEMIIKKAQEFKEEFKISSDRALLTWSGKTLKDMARAVSKQLEKEYDSTFRLCSRFSHPSIIGDREYMFQDEQKLTFSPLPSDIGAETNIGLASKYFLDFLSLADELFLNAYKTEISDMQEKLSSIISQGKTETDLSPEKKTKSQTILKESIVHFKTNP